MLMKPDELCLDGKDLDSIPPTETAFFEHISRAAHVYGHIWYVTGNKN